MSNEAFPAAAIQNPELLFQGQTLEGVDGAESLPQGQTLPKNGDYEQVEQMSEAGLQGQVLQDSVVDEAPEQSRFDRATEFTRNHLPQVATFLAGVAMTAGGIYEYATNATPEANAARHSKGMAPRQVARQISFVGGSNSVHPYKASLRRKEFTMYQKCGRDSSFVIKSQRISDMHVEFINYCNGAHVGGKKPSPLPEKTQERLQKRLNIAGPKVARSVGIKPRPAVIGNTQFIKANRKNAKVLFAHPTAEDTKPGVKPVRSIRIVKNRKPHVTRYKK